jgi:hypothetical protein
MKIAFKNKIEDQLASLPTMGGVKLTYTLFMGSSREADLSNICVVVDKFFCDALVEAGKLPDDSVSYLQSIDYRFGGVDKSNPRVEITLEPTSIKEDTNMRIFLVQTEIEQALQNYISEQMSVADGKAFEIKIAATRGDEGFTAEINIVDKVETPETIAKEAKEKVRRGPRNKVSDAVAALQFGAHTESDIPVVDDPADLETETETEGSTEGETAPTAEEAGVPAFLQGGKKSIFGTAN